MPGQVASQTRREEARDGRRTPSTSSIPGDRATKYGDANRRSTVLHAAPHQPEAEQTKEDEHCAIEGALLEAVLHGEAEPEAQERDERQPDRNADPRR